MDHFIFLTYIPAIISGIYWLTFINNRGINKNIIIAYNRFYISYSSLIISSSVITYIILNINSSVEYIKVLSVVVFICSAPMVYYLGMLELKIRDIKITPKHRAILLIPIVFAPISSFFVFFDYTTFLTFGFTLLQISFIFIPPIMVKKVKGSTTKVQGSTFIRFFEVIGVIIIIALELLLRKDQLLKTGIVYSLPITYLFLNVFNLIFKESLYPFIFIPKNSFNITPKEKEVIKYLKEGLGNKEIAFEMDISFSTVKNHIYNIYKKTGAQSRIELLKILKNSI